MIDKMTLPVINEIINKDYNTIIDKRYINDMFNKFIDILEEYNKKWIYHFLLFFEYDFKYVDDLKNNGYKSLFDELKLYDKYNYLNNIDIYSNIIIKIDIKNNIKNINFEYIFNYLKKILIKFTTTWYGRNIFTYDKNNIKSYKNLYNFEKKITFKNIYNYAKCLIHDRKTIDDKNITSNPDNKIVNLLYKEAYGGFIIWDGLSSDNNINKRLNFLKKFKQNNSLNKKNKKKKLYEWFNIKKIYNIVHEQFINKTNKTNKTDTEKINIINSEYNEYIYNIFDYLNTFKEIELISESGIQIIQSNNLIDIVFQCMVYDGILSEVVLQEKNNIIHDKNKLQTNRIECRKTMGKIMNENDYSEYIYYLNKKYMKDIFVDIHNKTNYIQDIINNHSWMTLYSFDWIN
jgi:hypothetical protein